MTRQLQQVVFTYTTRRSLWLMLVFGCVCIVPSLALSFVPDRPGRDSSPFAIFSVGFATGVVGWILLTQAKWQFCDQRARLLPGFAAPHLAVISAIAAIGLGLYPFGLAMAWGLSPLGIAACSIGIGSCIVWSMHSSNGLFTILAIVQYFSLMVPPGIDFWNGDRFAPIHAAIFVAGWITLVAWLRRLTTMREEDSDFLIPIQAQQGSATRMERTQSARTIARMMVRSAWQRLPADWWHDRLARVHATTTAARQRLLRYGFAPTPIWINAVLMAASFALVFYFISRIGFLRGPNRNVGSLLASLNMMIVMPAIIPGGMLAMRRARMQQELLLPLGRREYLNGLFVAAALNAVILWIASHAALLGLIAILAPASLTIPFVAGLTGLSLGVQIYAFGVLVWIARKSSGGVRLVGTMAILIPAMVVLMIGMQGLPQPVTPPAEVKRQVQQAYDESYRTVDADLSPEDRARIKGQIRDSTIRQAGPPTNGYVAWVCAGVLAAAGTTAFLPSRRRWLDLELG